MKPDTHPASQWVVFRDTTTKTEFLAQSTIATDEKTKFIEIQIDGQKQKCPVLEMDVTSDSHPFYTGKQYFVDSARRVQKFEAKRERAKNWSK